jgi:hypothetical protein
MNHEKSCESCPEVLSTDVHDRSLVRVLLRLAQNFVRHRCSIPFAESNVLQQVRNRVPFTPTGFARKVVPVGI